MKSNATLEVNGMNALHGPHLPRAITVTLAAAALAILLSVALAAGLNDLAWTPAPTGFRREHEQEILAVLMAGAEEGQQWPRLGEAANLIKHALWMRLGLSRGGIMINERTFPISVDRPSRTLMTAFGARRKAPRVEMSPSTIDVRMGWAFQATIPREDVVSARPLNRGELRGPFRLSVLRGVNYWRRHRACQWRRYRAG